MDKEISNEKNRKKNVNKLFIFYKHLIFSVFKFLMN